MGRVFSVDFEDSDYYMCKNCRTHIALPLYPNAPQPGRLVALFVTVINVEVSNQHRSLPAILSDVMHTVSDVYCVKCGDHLGFKYTTSGERMLMNDLAQLEMKKLLWRKGG